MRNFLLIFLSVFLIGFNSQFLKAQGLSGDYYIGVEHSYTSFTDALDAIAEFGTEGDVTFWVEPGTYEEQLYVSLMDISNGIYFKAKPENTEPVIVQHTEYVMTMEAAHTIYFEGITFKLLYAPDLIPQSVVLSSETAQGFGTVSFNDCMFLGPEFFLNKATMMSGKTLVNIILDPSETFSNHFSFDFCTFVNGTYSIEMSMSLTPQKNTSPASGLNNEKATQATLSVRESKFENFQETGIYTQDVDYVFVRGNSFQWSQNSMYTSVIRVSAATTVDIIRNDIAGIANGEFFEGITAMDCNSVHISGNTIDVNIPYDGTAISASYTFDRTEILGNYVKLTSDNYSNATGIRVDNTGGSSLIANNMVIAYTPDDDSNIRGLQVENYSQSGPSKVVYNSISIPRGGGIPFMYGDYYTPNLTLLNNIFSNNSYYPVVDFQSEITLDVVSNNNIFYTNGGDLIQNYAYKNSYSDIQSWYAATNQDKDSYSENPQFKDPQNDLHLKRVNPAAGRALPDGEVLKDFDGTPRHADTPDIGADEGNFILMDFVVDAGPDMEDCSNVFWLQAKDPSPAKGEWSVIQGSVIFENISDPSTKITNVQPGENILKWTVTDGGNSAEDFVRVHNFQPIADAGQNIRLFLEDISGLFPDINLSPPDAIEYPFGGYWETVSGFDGSETLVSFSGETAMITNIQAGKYSLMWTVVNQQLECSNSDIIELIAGYSFVSNPPAGGQEMKWNDPTHWDLGAVPGPSDSVTIFNTIVNFLDSEGACDQLFIGSGTEFNMRGTAKSTTTFRTKGLYLEQSAVKFKGIKGGAVMNIFENAELIVAADATKEGESVEESGIYVRDGGVLNIESTLGTKAGSAKLTIGSGGGLYIEQTAVKSDAGANVRIGSGGGLYIEQTAVKSSNASNNPGIRIGNGGGLYIEQTAVKGNKSAGEVVLGNGRGIYIEQTAVKSNANAGLHVRGGGLYIEQTAVKSTGNPGRITVGKGGGLYIEQTAVKATASVAAPFIEVIGGEIVVGSGAETKVSGGQLAFRGLYIEQTAVKQGTANESLIINQGAELIIDSRYTQGSPKFEIAANTAVTAKPGSVLFPSIKSTAPQLILHEGASFVNQSDGSELSGTFEQIFKAGEIHTIAMPFGSFNTGVLNFEPEVLSWSEPDDAWYEASNKEFGKMQGFTVSYADEDNPQIFTGDFNKGAQAALLSKSATGFNLSGNPYTSGIDISTFDFGTDVNPVVYVYDAQNKTFKLYSQSGVILNNASSFVPVAEAFVLHALVDNANFEITPDAQVHSAQQVKAKTTPSETLILSVSGADAKDELAVGFASNATSNFDSGLDALKYTNFESGSINFFSKTDELSETKYAINIMPLDPNAKVVPVYFESDTYGEYSIELSVNTIENSNVDILLYDTQSGEYTNLKENPIYTFEHIAKKESSRFELHIGKGVGAFQVSFSVTDQGEQAIEGAEILIENEQDALYTDASGEALIDLANGSYEYTVSKAGYFDFAGSFTVADEIEIVNIQMTQNYTVTFTVSDGTNMLEGAQISIEGIDDELYTDTEGEAVIPLANGTYNYEVFLTDYELYTGSFTVSDEEQTVDIVLEASVGVENVEFNVFVFPNPSQGEFTVQTPHNAQVQVIDPTGKVILTTQIEKSGKITIDAPGIYILMIESEMNTTVQKVIVK